MGLLSDTLMNVLATSLLEQYKKEKITILGEKVFYLLMKNGKVEYSEVQNEFNAIAQSSVFFSNSTVPDDAPVKERKTRTTKNTQPQQVAEKPRRGRKPKAVNTPEVRTKRKYVRRVPLTK
ncbi:MAG: hypothetical protein LBH05_00710 [Deferribacteraceae bacterium]|jgi:hypothetical protein|nr:hypothetical protein [Deferribacteraceae bacterium]